MKFLGLVLGLPSAVYETSLFLQSQCLTALLGVTLMLSSWVALARCSLLTLTAVAPGCFAGEFHAASVQGRTSEFQQ